MPFCNNCGAKIEEGDKFCCSCGTVNKSSQTDIQQTQSNILEEKTVENNFNPEKVHNIFNDILCLVKGMIIAPISTINSNYKKTDGYQTHILAAAITVIQGLLFIWFIKQLVGKTGFGSFIELPYGKIFFNYLVIFAVSMAGLLAGLFVMGRYVYKGSNNIIALWNIVVYSYVPYTFFIVIGIIIGNLSFYLGIVIIIIGFLAFILCIFSGAKECLNISDNGTAITVPIAYLFMMFLIFITAKAFINALHI